MSLYKDDIANVDLSFGFPSIAENTQMKPGLVVKIQGSKMAEGGVRRSMIGHCFALVSRRCTSILDRGWRRAGICPRQHPSGPVYLG